jgi:hypothetical protein
LEYLQYRSGRFQALEASLKTFISFDDAEEDDALRQPIETYPGYLGHCMDNDFFLGPELKPLLAFDFQKYGELVDGERQLGFVVPSGKVSLSFTEGDDIVGILDQLPTVDVFRDESPNKGMASAVIWIFFVAEGVGKPELEISIAALVKALQSDFAMLKKS